VFAERSAEAPVMLTSSAGARPGRRVAGDGVALRHDLHGAAAARLAAAPGLLAGHFASAGMAPRPAAPQLSPPPRHMHAHVCNRTSVCVHRPGASDQE